MEENRPLVTRFKIVTDEDGVEHQVITSCVYAKTPTSDEIYDEAMKRDRIDILTVVLSLVSIICFIYILFK